MWEHEIASEMYSYFYRKYTQGAYGFQNSPNNNTLLSNFLKRVKSDNITIGVNWLFDYMAFQFYYAMQSNYKSVYPAFVFGVKAYQRWKVRNVKTNIYVRRNFLNSRSIVKEIAIRGILEDVIGADYCGLDISDADEGIKKRYNKNLFACLNLTSLWNPASTHCYDCSNVKECKIALNDRNYELYNLRLEMDKLIDTHDFNK